MHATGGARDLGGGVGFGAFYQAHEEDHAVFGDDLDVNGTEVLAIDKARLDLGGDVGVVGAHAERGVGANLQFVVDAAHVFYRARDAFDVFARGGGWYLAGEQYIPVETGNVDVRAAHFFADAAGGFDFDALIFGDGAHGAPVFGEQRAAAHRAAQHHCRAATQ